jgi:hypothetical protein
MTAKSPDPDNLTSDAPEQPPPKAENEKERRSSEPRNPDRSAPHVPPIE